MKNFFIFLSLTAAISCTAFGFIRQSGGRQATNPKVTPAYEVLVLRRVAIESELVDLSSSYTADAPNVRAKQFELSELNREIERMQTLEKSSVANLSSLYGDLILKKVRLEVELNDLVREFTPQHPDVKRKKAEVAALDHELEELLR